MSESVDGNFYDQDILNEREFKRDEMPKDLKIPYDDGSELRQLLHIFMQDYPNFGIYLAEKPPTFIGVKRFTIHIKYSPFCREEKAKDFAHNLHKLLSENDFIFDGISYFNYTSNKVLESFDFDIGKKDE